MDFESFWTAAARCSFPVHSLLWTTVLNLKSLQPAWFGSRLPALKRQQAAAVQGGGYLSLFIGRGALAGDSPGCSSSVSAAKTGRLRVAADYFAKFPECLP